MMAAVKTQVNPPRPLTTVHPKMTARRPMNRATGRLVGDEGQPGEGGDTGGR